MATAKKRGRKQKHHEAADGSTIVGLSKMKDGRWRIIGTQIRFSAVDESKAIEEFEKRTGKKLPVGGRLETHLNDDGSTREEAVARYNNGFTISFRSEADY